jgi:hypothetical protein
MDEPLANWTKKRMEKTQIFLNKIIDEKGSITTNTSEISRIIREYFEKPIIKSTGKSRRNG